LPERTRVRGGNSPFSLSLSLSLYLVGDARLIYADRMSYLFHIIRRGPIQDASKESDRYLRRAARVESALLIVDFQLRLFIIRLQSEKMRIRE